MLLMVFWCYMKVTKSIYMKGVVLQFFYEMEVVTKIFLKIIPIHLKICFEEMDLEQILC